MTTTSPLQVMEILWIQGTLHPLVCLVVARTQMPGAACLFCCWILCCFFLARDQYIMITVWNWESCGRKHLSNYQMHELKSEHMKFINILENSLDYEYIQRGLFLGVDGRRSTVVKFRLNLSPVPVTLSDVPQGNSIIQSVFWILLEWIYHWQASSKHSSKHDKWVLVFIPSYLYFSWTYGDPPRALPRPAFLLPREQVQNSSFRELPRSKFFYDFSRSASAVTQGASARAFCRGCMDICCLYLLVGRAWWDNVFGCTGWRVWSTYQSNTFRFWTSQMANTCDIFWWVNHFFMILSSIQMGWGSFSASAWKVCFR